MDIKSFVTSVACYDCLLNILMYVGCDDANRKKKNYANHHG